VESEAGVGSTFSFAIPIEYVAPRTFAARPEWKPDPSRLPLLVVEDAPDAQFFYEKIFRTSPYQIYPAASIEEVDDALVQMTPVAIVMDLVLGGEEAWDLLIKLKRQEYTRQIPLIVVSVLSEREKGLALGADAYLVKPIDRRSLLQAIGALHGRTQSAVRVLAIDDEEVARYLVTQCLPSPAFDVTAASNAEEGLRRARADHPDVIVLDLIMPGLDGRGALAELRQDPLTRDIPVVISTAAELGDEETRELLAQASLILPKRNLSRATLPDAVRQALDRALQSVPFTEDR
jgi:CheY-like chemotaxis protein